MPRIREATESDAPVTDEQAAKGQAAEKAARAPRREAPEGVTLGLRDEPVEVPEPPTTARSAGRGRTVDQKTVNLIATLTANPGKWYFVGTYMTGTPPTNKSALGQHGFEFKHSRNENGITFDRYV